MPDQTAQTIELIRQTAAEQGIAQHTASLVAKYQRGVERYGAENASHPWVDTVLELYDECLDSIVYPLLTGQRVPEAAPPELIAKVIHLLYGLVATVPMCEQPLRFFVSGPYRHADPTQVDEHITNARKAKAALMRRGHYTYCPHSESAWFEEEFPDIPDYRHLHGCIAWLEYADAIFLLPGWEESEGAMVEHGYASSRGLPVYTDILQVPLVEGTLWEANSDKV